MSLELRPSPVQPKRPLVPPRRPSQQSLERLNDVLGVQAIVQDASRAAQLGARQSRTLRVAAGLAAGDELAISRVVAHASQGVSRVVSKLPPSAAVRANKLATSALKGLGRTAQVIGKWGPLISLPFAAYDVVRAVKEPDPAKQRAAWANAGLSVGGSVLGATGALLVASPAGAPLLLASAAIAAFQLGDAHLWDGKLTQRLGDSTAALWAGR